MIIDKPSCAQPLGANAYLTTARGSIWCRVIAEDETNLMFRIRTYRRRKKCWSAGTRNVPRDRVITM